MQIPSKYERMYACMCVCVWKYCWTGKNIIFFKLYFNLKQWCSMIWEFKSVKYYKSKEKSPHSFTKLISKTLSLFFSLFLSYFPGIYFSSDVILEKFKISISISSFFIAFLIGISRWQKGLFPSILQSKLSKKRS